MTFTFDPITLDICWNRLIGVVNEQAAALMRTSFTSIVREAGDLSAGVFDRRGWMVAQAVTGTPGHINSMALAMKHVLDVYPVDAWEPGDVIITNDPWKTSGHLNDVTICNPVFRGRDLVAFFASTCHSADIGGHVLSAEAREVYEEGLFIPIMKLYEGGRINASLEAMIRSNVRVPDLVMGDFHAQVAGGAVGGDRLLEFMEEFGLERLEPLSDEIVTRTERAMREAIARLRPGTYEYAITSDGYGEPVTITCRCEVKGDSLWVDFTGSSPASRRGVNVVMNYTEAYTTYGVKVIVSPDVPNNEGAFRVLRITAPEGSILNVQHRAPWPRATSSATSSPTWWRAPSSRRCPTMSWPRARPTSGGSSSRARTGRGSLSSTPSSARAARARAPPRTVSPPPPSPPVCWARPSRSWRRSPPSSSSARRCATAPAATAASGAGSAR
jgi:N-methylhydantoinase B